MSFTRIPSVIEEGMEFILKGYKGEIELPESLIIKGTLKLINCEGLKALPKDLIVQGDLILDGCSIEHLDGELVVGGNLSLSCCYSLQSLPSKLTVGGDLSLRCCYKLNKPPEYLSVGGVVDMEWCGELKSVAAFSAVIRQDLLLRGCSSLKYLNNVTVGGSLTAVSCESLETVSDTLVVNKGVDFHCCTKLKNLPVHLFNNGIKASVSEISTLPTNFCNGNLDLHCSSLTSLPDHMVVNGDLDLHNCPALTSLPEGLIVHGDLDLMDCTNLSSLPENMTVDGNLRLTRCNIKEIPKGVKAANKILN